MLNFIAHITNNNQSWQQGLCQLCMHDAAAVNFSGAFSAFPLKCPMTKEQSSLVPRLLPAFQCFLVNVAKLGVAWG